jgi:hypothetical protein
LTPKKHATPFVVELKPSIKLQRIVILIYLIALAASIANALPFSLKLCIASLIGLHCKMCFPNLKTERRKIRHTEKLGWEIAEHEDFEAAVILKSTVVTTFFIFLHIQNKPSILIANDALSEDDYRQLIVKLKMTAHEHT